MLNIQNLSIAYQQNKTLLTAVRDFSLNISSGQTYGLVGESGSGKTTLALAIMRYLGENGKVIGGQIEVAGVNLLDLSLTEARELWGRDITLVPQDPLSSLNPSIRIGEQLAEGLRGHQGLSPQAANNRAIELLDRVRVPDPVRVAQSYPHEISGGMQQRVLIAMALGAEPKLLVLDEPTTSLDVTTQAAVIDLLRDLIQNMDTAVLYITHNLGVVARICERVAVLYAGELVEDAATKTLFEKPLHPYTRGLLDSIPKIGHSKSRGRLSAIPGRIPSLSERHTGCVFAPRCVLAIDRCYSERPSLDTAPIDRKVRCHRWPEIEKGEISARQATLHAETNDDKEIGERSLLVKDVNVEYSRPRSIWEAMTGQARRSVKAVDGANIYVMRGETLGLVGESGSGKTSLARAIVGLVTRSSGEIDLMGLSLEPVLSHRNIDTLRLVQYVFQNPEEALNPYLSIGETLRRPFITLLGQSKAEAHESALNLLAAVKLPEDYIHAYPNRLSGGEKQRVAIARAFATSPALLIADEPVSSLDVSVQASILNLMSELQADANSSMLFITHDLAVVGFLADRIAVMYAGHIVEVAHSDTLFDPPYHPYTEALLSSVPVTDPSIVQSTIPLVGDVPSQMNLPSGCRFHPRCPRFLGDICREMVPPWQETGSGDRIHCHIPLDLLEVEQRRVDAC